MRTPVRYLILVPDLLSTALFLASGGLAGKADGWVAVFEKAGGR